MTKPVTNFFANGKLLLTAEYFVLKGAKALALPVRHGQSLKVQPPDVKTLGKETFYWQAFYENQPWFLAELDCRDYHLKETTDPGIAETLVALLKTITELNPEFRVAAGTTVRTDLEFNPSWGLGSSSTLVVNMADWGGVNPYVLNEIVFQGSGFDIACAHATGPVFYIKGREAGPVALDYPFADHLYLVYSGTKQATRGNINRTKLDVREDERRRMSALTDRFAACTSLDDFQTLIKVHEQKVAELLGQLPVHERLFPDFAGAVKSLGAWGGDFFLVASDRGYEPVQAYFAKRGMTDFFRWNEMIK